MLKQLKGKEVPALRKKWWLEQDKKCPVTGKEISLNETVLDHQHKLKGEEANEDGRGICRGVLSNRANAWEGKIWNSFKRLGLREHVDIVTALRNLADYLEKNHIHDEVQFIHPSEAPKRKKVKKSCYNKLVSEMKKANDKRKIPKYTGNLSKSLSKLLDDYKIEAEFYGDQNEDRPS